MIALRVRVAAMLGRRAQDGEPANLPDLLGVPPALPEVEFEAFTEHFRIWSRVRLAGDRMTDMLNAADELVLHDVLVAGLDTALGTEIRELRLGRDELLAVRPSGGRGQSARRSRTRAHPVVMKIGPYLVRGYLHAIPGVDPLRALNRRRQMVPLTDAWLEWESAGGTQQEPMGTLIVNQRAIEWIVPSVDDAVRMPYLPLPPAMGFPVKDYTWTSAV